MLTFSTSAHAQNAQLIWSAPCGDSSIRREAWAEKLFYPIAQRPHITDELVVCCFPHYHVLGINNSTGKRTWSFPWLTSKRSDIIHTGAKNQFWETRKNSFSLDKDRQWLAFVDVPSKRIHALIIASEGKLEWSDPDRHGAPNQQSAIPLGPPCFIDESAFCVIADKSKYWLVALDSDTGKEQQRIDLGEAVDESNAISHTPAVCGDILAVTLPSGKVLGLRLGDLATVWTYDIESLLDKPFRLHVHAGHLLLLSNGVCRCIDGATGNKVWQKNELQPYPFVIQNDSVVLSVGSQFSSFKILTGEKQWSTVLRKDDAISGNGTIDGASLALPINATSINRYDLSTGQFEAKFNCRFPAKHLFGHDGFVYSLSATRITKYLLPAVADR
jgi:outer membrane protein assembly factor BamB